MVSVNSTINPPPAVSLSYSSSSLVAPAFVTLNATASDNNGIARVDFYGDGALLGSDSSSPYSWSWANLPAGTHVATAQAYDTLGASTTSAQLSFTVTPPAPSTYFGYWFTGIGLEEVVAHTNLSFELGIFNDVDPNSIQSLETHVPLMRANGMKAMLEIGYIHVTDPNGHVHYLGNVDKVRALLDHIKRLGGLDLVVAFYPIDEPDMTDLSSNDIRDANAAIHALCAEYPELGGCAIAVIYSDHNPTGAQYYDWIGTDAGNYYLGPNSMELNPGQRLILIPGGADPWRMDPTSYLSYAQDHPEVVLIMPFLWISDPPPPPLLALASTEMA
ncbi:MAG: Ig-like domain-containing protein [Casimicrobiaceae bacterium]